MRQVIAIIALAAICGCATLNPGADPFVVRVEQTQASASGAFDMVLRLDNANRTFWATNAPGFHQFCEWLRTPTAYSVGQVPRVVAIQLNVDDLKQAYKFSKSEGTSNALYAAWSVLNAAIVQTASWSNIITAPIRP